MKLSDFKDSLRDMSQLQFMQVNGKPVDAHFHITEAGLTTKHFIDCGGTVRKESKINFQLYLAQDLEHRLSPEKLLGIIRKSEKVLSLEDHEIEVEYTTDTIGRYGIEFNGYGFQLLPLRSDCLAKDNCGISSEKEKVSLSELGTKSSACCAPGSGCC
ncbi:MAG: DUF6428 family protein [Bacteroidia bacterium]